MDPVDHHLVMHSQVPGNPPKIHPIGIEAYSLLTHLIRVAGLFGMRGVRPLTVLAFEALAADTGSPGFNLMVCGLTVRAGIHLYVLSHIH